MSWIEWAPGAPHWLAAWPRGRESAAVHHPSGSRRGRTDPGERAGRSSGRIPSEMRPRRRRRRRRRKRRRSRTGSLPLRPASWPPPPGSAPPVWQWCHWGSNHEHLGSPGGRRCFLWPAELPCAALCWESLSAALYHRPAWKRIRILIRISSMLHDSCRAFNLCYLVWLTQTHLGRSEHSNHTPAWA